MIMKLSGMLQKKSIIPQGSISSGRDLARFAHLFLGTGLPIKDETSETTVRNVYSPFSYIHGSLQLLTCFVIFKIFK